MKHFADSALKLFKKKTVLVIEDDSALRKVLADRINAEGWRAIEATGGQGGLASALNEHPDAILLDLMLPQMDGIALLTELRKDEWGKTAKVLIMSNLVKGVGLIEQVKAYGVADYIEKADMSLDALIVKVKGLL